ncbi:MAG: hypothetical protein M3296_11330 [Actinomycetota bacterium]|nr:hypothetical protein [Actinomycetota bacterium]
MRRALLIAAGLVSALPASAAAQDRPALRAGLESCQTGLAAAERVATFVGSMPALAGTQRMWMRFDLERRRPGQRRWRRVRGAPGFGRWERSLPGRGGFVFHKRVEALHVPATFRAVVRFRWYAAGGVLQRATRLRTRSCAQPDLRPDLVPGTLTALPVAPGLARYALEVRNAGSTDAGGFTVRVGDGSVQVARLGAGERRAVEVTAAACAPGTAVAVAVDPEGRVDEARERDDAVALPCPWKAPEASGPGAIGR